MRNNRLWENINKISIVFVFTVMCVITGVTNVRAEDARYTYYREITENTASDIGINVCYENVNQKGAGVCIFIWSSAISNAGDKVSIYLDNRCLIRDINTSTDFFIKPENFMEMNRRYAITLYRESINGTINIVSNYYIIFHKPLVKKTTTVSASQVYGEKAIQVKWDKIVGAQK